MACANQIPVRVAQDGSFQRQNTNWRRIAAFRENASGILFGQHTVIYPLTTESLIHRAQSAAIAFEIVR